MTTKKQDEVVESDEKKPREWRLTIEKGSSIWGVCGFETSYAEKGQDVVVVEKSAYDAVVEENAKLKKALEKYACWHNWEKHPNGSYSVFTWGGADQERVNMLIQDQPDLISGKLAREALKGTK